MEVGVEGDHSASMVRLDITVMADLAPKTSRLPIC